jgi:hypothetical protein
LKELGYINFPKPDVHLRDMFAALELCENEVDDYRLFKAIIRVAKNAGVTPYALDKLFWLIGRETFMTILRLGLLGAAKKTLSNSPCKKGAVDDSGTDAVQSIKIDSIGADNPAPIFLAENQFYLAALATRSTLSLWLMA